MAEPSAAPTETTEDQPDDYGSWVPPVLAANEKVAAEQAEQVYIKSSLPVIQEVLDWYDECIEKFKNPEVITGVNVSTPAEIVKTAVVHAQQQIASYQKKKREFIQRFSEYIDTEGGKTSES